MATGGVGGNGVRVGFSASSPVSYTSIGQLEDTDLPALLRDKIASSTHAANIKRAMPGMKEVEDLNLLLLADLNPATSAAHSALKTHFDAGTTLWWRFEVPDVRDGSTCIAFEIQAWIQKWKPKAPLEGKQELEVVIVYDGTTFTKYASGAFTLSAS